MVRLFLSLILLIFSLPIYSASIQNDLNIKLSFSKNKVWQREQVIIKLEVVSKDKLARLDSDNFELEGFTVVPLLQESVEIKDELHLRHSWQVFSQNSGEHTIALSNIKYRPNSGRAVVLKLPQKTLSVTALPIYIPPIMPVGKIAIEGDLKRGWNLLANRLYQWDISILTKQVAPETLPAISRLLRSSKEVQILPFKKIRKTINHADASYEINYQIPFKALSIGRLDLPKIEIQFFNPELGKIEKAVLEQPIVLVVNYFLLMLLSVIFIAFIAMIALRIFFKFKQRLITKKKIKEALFLIKQAENYPQIRAALSRFSVAKGWQENATLESFYQNLIENSQQGCKANGQLKNLLDQLQKYQFSNDRHTEIEALCNDIYKRLT